jgi:hypothetical protein
MKCHTLRDWEKQLAESMAKTLLVSVKGLLPSSLLSVSIVWKSQESPYAAVKVTHEQGRTEVLEVAHAQTGEWERVGPESEQSLHTFNDTMKDILWDATKQKGQLRVTVRERSGDLAYYIGNATLLLSDET